MNYPNKLTTNEWNLLIAITTHNHMDCWFELRDASLEDSNADRDYVRDLENDVDMNLHDAIEQVAEGVVNEDILMFENGRTIWNDMMKKFSLEEYCV